MVSRPRPSAVEASQTDFVPDLLAHRSRCLSRVRRAHKAQGLDELLGRHSLEGDSKGSKRAPSQRADGRSVE